MNSKSKLLCGEGDSVGVGVIMGGREWFLCAGRQVPICVPIF
jgi:hypothetical protein